MSRIAMRNRVCAFLLAVTFAAALPATAASDKTSGDGSGIGGTGNSPSGGGIGGTGAKEQHSPRAMPDLPDRPEIVETPSVEIPDFPAVDMEAGAPPDSLPEPPTPPTLPSAQ